jgi:hypothetical protein
MTASLEDVMRRIAPLALTLVFSTILAAAPTRGAGTGAADFLRITPDSEGGALGNSGAANADSAFAPFANPALVSRSEDAFRVAGGETRWPLGVSAGHYALSGAWGARGGRWGAAAFLGRWGTDPFDATDAEGSRIGSVDFGAQVAGLAVSHEVWRGLHVGGAMKRVSQSFTERGRSSSSQRTSADVNAWDFGAAVDVPWAKALVAVSLQNVGNELTFLQEREELPETARLGARGDLPGGQVSWTVEASRTAGAVAVGGGLELNVFSTLSLRAGYDSRQFDPNLMGFTTGLGFRIAGARLDYAMGSVGELGLTHRMSLSWRLKSSAQREEDRKAARAARTARRAAEPWLGLPWMR